MRAVVTGMIGTYPVGGVAWDYGQYALGLEQLGFEVYYLEDTGLETYDPDVRAYGGSPAYGIRFLEQALRAVSPTLGERWCFRSIDGKLHGPSASSLEDVVQTADVFLNVSGSCLVRNEYLPSRRKVLIDTDPGWNHFVNYPKWDKTPGWLGTHGYRSHDFFFTYAERLGRPGCRLPDLGLTWVSTRPPVVLDRWQVSPTDGPWTTVMTWNNFRREIAYDGMVYGTKEREFGLIEGLPSRLPARFELAVGGADPPTERWRRLGWSVVDSQAVSTTPDDYRGYIEHSRGEVSVAKNLYTATRSGWFSCRSVCYLAAGRPVVLQDTGFSEVLPTGSGLLAFSTNEEAARALEEVESSYDSHQRAARAVAEEFFDARRVLGEILERVLG